LSRRLLATTIRALRLAQALDTRDFSPKQRERVVDRAARHTEVSVRDLFERFLPAERRIKRLGSLIRPETILQQKGDPIRGKELFFQTGATQCATCHRVGNRGGMIGPDLSGVGKKYDRAKILEAILDPSKEIDKQYVTYVLQTTKGQLLSGLMVKRDETEVVLRDAQGKEHRVPAGQVEQLTASKKSLMPEQLLRDLTAQQAADLLEYLAQLR
jgi:putative heme-binding domain-containing protein